MGIGLDLAHAVALAGKGPDMLITEAPAPGKYCRYRLFEWAATAMLLGIGLCLFADPEDVRSEPFRYLITLGFSSTGLAFLFMGLGLLRCAALYLNGRIPVYGARARAFGALIGAVIWTEMLISLIAVAVGGGSLSVGIALFAPLVCGELISCHRAAADVRSQHG